MKVLLVNTLYPPFSEGGAERSVAQLATGLKQAGAEVSVATLTNKSSSVETMDGVRVRRLALRHLYWPYDERRRSAALRLAWHGLEAVGGAMDARVAEVVRQERPDLIHLHVGTGFGLSVARAAEAAGAPLLQTVRDYGLLCARSAMFRAGRRCSGRCGDCVLLTTKRKRASAHVQAWVAISRSLGDAHREAGYFAGRLPEIIGNAVSRPVAVPRPDFAAAPALVFGFLGRIQPEKGVELLLQAIDGLSGDWRLRIGGRGEATYLRALKRRFSDPRIEWLGQVEAGDFYREVDVVVTPALWPEPFGRVAAEAVAHGRGLITARIGGLLDAAGSAPFVLTHEAGDLNGLRAAMSTALANSRTWRVEALANGRATPAWTQADVVGAHLALYEDVLTRPSSAAAVASQR